MKIEHQDIKIAQLMGHATDEITLPNGEKAKIELNFEYGPEFQVMNVFNGFLYVGRTTLRFDRTPSNFRSTHLGPEIEEVSLSTVAMEYISDLMEKLKGVEVEVKFKNL